MVNQNNQPLIITEKVAVQAGQTSQFIDIWPGMGPDEQMNIYGLYCRIQDGAVNIGDIDNDGTSEFTFTDIQDVFIPSTRPEDYLALPVCCNPRPGMGEALDLLLFKGRHQIMRDNFIPLAIFNNPRPELTCDQQDMSDCGGHTSKILIFKEPFAIYPSERFRIQVRNNNPVPVDDRDNSSYSYVEISFLCEVIDKAITLELLQQQEQGMPA